MTAVDTNLIALVSEAPGGIPALRKLLLELAVTGKLLPALATHEVDGGKAAEAYPTGWQATTLAGLGRWAVGSGFPTVEQGKVGLPILFCKVSDMNLPGNHRHIETTTHSIDESAALRLRVNVHPAGAVVFPKIGGAIATNKRRVLTRPTAIDNNCLGIVPDASVASDFLYLLLSSIDFAEYQAGTSVPALSQGVLGEIPCGLPPLPEQHRIVAKVDELMALCDRLEARQQDAEAAHARLVGGL